MVSWSGYTKVGSGVVAGNTEVGSGVVACNTEVDSGVVVWFTERIACILRMHLGACRFFTHPTALMHLQ